MARANRVLICDEGRHAERSKSDLGSSSEIICLWLAVRCYTNRILLENAAFDQTALLPYYEKIIPSAFTTDRFCLARNRSEKGAAGHRTYARTGRPRRNAVEFRSGVDYWRRERRCAA